MDDNNADRNAAPHAAASDGRSLEENLAQLDNLVKALENNELTIDEAITKYEEGMQLAVACRKSLNDMTQKITIVRQNAMQALEQLENQEQQQQKLSGNQPQVVTHEINSPQDMQQHFNRGPNHGNNSNNEWY